MRILEKDVGGLSTFLPYFLPLVLYTDVLFIFTPRNEYPLVESPHPELKMDYYCSLPGPAGQGTTWRVLKLRFLMLAGAPQP